ncbi:hypothetical protein ABFS83_14G291800 [Erythranthe nasuta]
MGISVEIVRNVFSKSRSLQSNSHQTNSNGVEKKKWSSSVRSYLCGDEYNLVNAAADDDSTSVRNSTMVELDLASFRSNRATTNTSVCAAEEEQDTASEATVDQPSGPTDSKNEDSRREKRNSAHELFQQEDAALIIQSAFRTFLMARRAREGAKNEGAVSPSRESIGTSIEVQTGNSSDIFSIKDDTSFDLHHTIRHRNRAQVLKIQEDWDDSTLSSVMLKTRMQNRLEAATRRERALAYAFSQQLRICSKRKQIIMGDNDEMNTGWSWLQRWMAARGPEMEEKESCGSNEVSSLVEHATSFFPNNIPRPNKPRNKSTRSFSRQNSASSHLSPRESKEMKKVCHVEDKRKRAKQPENKKDTKNIATTIETIEQ